MVCDDGGLRKRPRRSLPAAAKSFHVGDTQGKLAAIAMRWTLFGFGFSRLLDGPSFMSSRFKAPQSVARHAAAFIIVVVVLALLGACRTPYQRSGFKGGYTDYRAGADMIYVTYSGNGYTDADTIIRYWHLRAAEVCGGPDKYEVIARTDRSTSTQIGGTHTSYSGSARTVGNYTTFSGTARESAPVTVNRQSAAGYVRCVNGGDYDPSRKVYDKRGNATSQAASALRQRPLDESRDNAFYSTPPSVSPPRFMATAAPKGAVGYELGASREATAETCRMAEQELSQVSADVMRCSGTSPEFGNEAIVTVRFCQEKLCQIDVSFPPYGTAFHQWFKRYDEIWQTLAHGYGRPMSDLRRLAPQCGQSYLGCFATGDVRFAAIWKWQSGTAVKLSNGPRDSFVHVNYFSAEALATRPDAQVVPVPSEPSPQYHGF